MMVILGLGNPGRAYAASRHNVGYRCVDALAQTYAIRLEERRRVAVLGQGAILGQEVVLARSRSYMNLSGLAARYLVDRYRISPSALLVLYDDMDLPLGTIRIRGRGSAGGHNGVKSIIDDLQTQDFPRLRIGVGRPQDQGAVAHVLGRFTPLEATLVDEAVQRAVEAVTCVAKDGLESAMNLFNRRALQGDQEEHDP